MQDKELYRQLLGLRDPWKVSGVQIDFEGQKVDVWVEWPPEKQALCSECGKSYVIYDHRDERQWRHLDTMQFQTILHCRIPRVKCQEHGVKSIDVPWSEKNSRFTALFERLSIDVLLGCQNQTKAKELLKLSWDEVHLIQEKAVQRGFQRRDEGALHYIGVDEKSFLKGHRYATVLSDLDNASGIRCCRRSERGISCRIIAQDTGRTKGRGSSGGDRHVGAVYQCGGIPSAGSGYSARQISHSQVSW